jgi:hypothetical protein
MPQADIKPFNLLGASMKILAFFSVAAFLVALALITSAFAQESSYKPGTVWNMTYVRVEPGQFENYMDYLNGTYKKSMEFQKKEGYIVSWHVYVVANRREGEPDVILAVEQKDHLTNAQQLELQKKVSAFLATDPHKADAGFGERKKMRTVSCGIVSGGMEIQELTFG